jgi:hypothetical protein
MIRCFYHKAECVNLFLCSFRGYLNRSTHLVNTLCTFWRKTVQRSLRLTGHPSGSVCMWNSYLFWKDDIEFRPLFGPAYVTAFLIFISLGQIETISVKRLFHLLPGTTTHEGSWPTQEVASNHLCPPPVSDSQHPSSNTDKFVSALHFRGSFFEFS